MLGDNSRSTWGQAGTQAGWNQGPPQQGQTGWNAGSQHPQAPLTGWNQPTPQNGTASWTNSAQPARQQGQGWGNPTPAPAANGWNAPAQPAFSKQYDPRGEDAWNAAPGIPTGPASRSRANSWGVSQAVSQADAWDTIPGIPTGHVESKLAQNWTAPVVQSNPYTTPQPVGNWTPPEHIRQRSQQWSGPPQPPVVQQHPQQQGKPGWAPSGWDPLPPPTQPVVNTGTVLFENAPKWDGQRPAGVTVMAQPTVNLAFEQPIQISENSVTVGKQTVKFEVIEEPVTGTNSTPVVEAETINGDQKQQIRKVRSTSGLDRKVQQPPANATQRNVGPNGMWKKEVDKKDLKSMASKDNLKDDKTAANGTEANRIQNDPSKAQGVYIYGFPKWVQVADIILIFSRYGTIVNVGLVGKTKQQERLYAYVDYENTGSAAKAVEALKSQNVFEMSKPLELKMHYDRRVLEDISAPAPASAPALAPAAAPIATVKKESGHVKKESKDFKSVLAIKKDELEQKKEKIEDKSDVDLRTLHVGNLPQNVDKTGLEKVFAVYGAIKRIHIVQRPKEKRAFAFVSFRDESAAKKALAAIKVNKFFDMTEPLRAEYSKLQTPVEKKSVTAAAIDKPWKKGEALKQLEVQDKKKEEQKKAEAKRKVVLPPAPPKKELPTIIYVAQAGAIQSAEILAKFTEHGAVKAHHIIPRLAAPLQPATEPAEETPVDPALENASKAFAVVVFEDPDKAANAASAKIFGGVFPRQRRVIVRGFSATATEDEVRAWFATVGDIRKLEVYTAGVEAVPTSDVWWLVEYMRAEAASKLLVKCVEETYLTVKLHAEYAPSARVPKKGKTPEEKKEEDALVEAEEEQVAKEAEAVEAAKAQEYEAALAAVDTHVEPEEDTSDDEELIQAELAVLEGSKPDNGDYVVVSAEEKKE